MNEIPPLNAAALLKRYDLRAHKGLGQNFLQDRDQSGNPAGGKAPMSWYCAEARMQMPACNACNRVWDQQEDVVAEGGIEPPTQGFSVLCSTN